METRKSWGTTRHGATATITFNSYYLGLGDIKDRLLKLVQETINAQPPWRDPGLSDEKIGHVKVSPHVEEPELEHHRGHLFTVKLLTFSLAVNQLYAFSKYVQGIVDAFPYDEIRDMVNISADVKFDLWCGRREPRGEMHM